MAELKRQSRTHRLSPGEVTPRLTAVAELKHPEHAAIYQVMAGDSTAHRRGRIETIPVFLCRKYKPGDSTAHRRGRIET